MQRDAVCFDRISRAARRARAIRSLSAVFVLACLVVACSGSATSAVDVTDTTATLVGTASCSGTSYSTPCTAWFQYWRDNPDVLVSTPEQVDNAPTDGVPIRQAVGGLVPGALYHYQFCGYGDSNVGKPGVCVGQEDGDYITAPGLIPPALPLQPGAGVFASNLSATANFLTANPAAGLPLKATIDLGRVLTTGDIADYNPGASTSGAVSRDTGYSVPYGTNTSLWLFGDTTYGCIPSASSQSCLFAAGTTAAAGVFTPGRAPTALGEMPAASVAGGAAPVAGAAPSSFFPAPVGLQFMTPVSGVNTVVNCTPAQFSGAVTGRVMTVRVMQGGSIAVGQMLYGGGALAGTTVTAQLSGTPGLVGTYSVSQSQTVPYSYLLTGYGAGSYPATWSSGGAQMPGSTKLLLVHSDVCVSGSAGFAYEKLHILQYDPATNLISNDSTPFLAAPLIAGLSPQEMLASPVFGNDGYLYLYSFTNVCMDNPGCSAKTVVHPNAIYAARVSANPLTMSWKQKSSFEWWCGTAPPCPLGPSRTPGWTGVEADARSVVAFPTVTLPNGLRVVQGPFGHFSAGYYGANSTHKYVITAEAPPLVAGQQVEFMAFESSTPYGPFTFTLAGAVPDACLPGHGCYAVYGHPELSTSTQLVFSWFSSDDRLDAFAYPLVGHVRLGAVGWN